MVRDFAGPLAGGSSTLVRAGDGLAFTLTTSGLSPRSQYTVWWVGFNPDNSCTWGSTCTCTGNDLRLGPNGRDAVLYAGGGRTDDLGNATFTGHIGYGELPGGEGQMPAGGSALDEGVEVHFVVRSHAGRGRQ